MVIWLQLPSGVISGPARGRMELCARGLAGRRPQSGSQPQDPVQYSIADPVRLTARLIPRPRGLGSGEALQPFEHAPQAFGIAFRPARFVQPLVVDLLSARDRVLTQS